VLARTDRRLYQLIIRHQIAVESLFSIVVVEDHDEYREALVEFLQREGHRVMDFDSAETLMHGALPESVDLFMIDLNLPGEDGLVLAKRLRESMPAVGIIMLTARGYPEDVTRGYQNGADIYLNKPASAAQLRAALGVMRRRLGGTTTGESIPRLERRKLCGTQSEVMLTTTEALVLAALARAGGRQLRTEQIIQAIGKDPESYQKHSLEAAMTRLRKKIQDACADDLALQSVRGEGYRLSASVQIITG